MICVIKKRALFFTGIVAMSANAYMEGVKKCLAAGMNEHVSKPVFKDTLISALATQMNVK